MKVPFGLEPGKPGRIDAILVPDPARVLEVVPALPGPVTLFALASGVLVRPARPVAGALPGTIALQALAPDLHVLAGSRLVPALLADEARDLTRARGLVFLPSGVLAFAPEDPLPLGRLVTAPGLARGRFGPLPAAAPRPDRVRELLLESEESPESIVEAARPAPAPEPAASPPPPPRGAWSRLVRWVEGALGRTPGAPPPEKKEPAPGQEQQLRWLLQQFREGNLERALGRALPMSEENAPAGPPARNPVLPTQDPRWNLGRALEGSGGGGQTWRSDLSLQIELAREYRKVADQAIQAGDWRRAAFVLGKLLRDWRAAAQALERGGLHHDAAVLWHRKVNDPRAAARAYEAAGEVDQALGLYRDLEDHVSAGHLLKRAGDAEGALGEYVQAARRLEREGATGYAAAAELLLRGAERPDLALDALERGWKTRPGPAAGFCLLPLVRLQAERRAASELLRIAREAEEHFAVSDGSQAPFEAFAQLARAAGSLDDRAAAAELRDRARLAIARELVAQRRSPLEATWLVGSAGFGDSVVADATHAVRGARRPRS